MPQEPVEKRKPEEARRIRRIMQRRIMCVMLLLGLATFVALFFQLYELTINRHEELSEMALNQQTMSTTISASRGTIYDRNGNILAISATADTVFLDPKAIQTWAKSLDKKRAAGEDVMSGEDYRQYVAQTLAELLELESEDILKRMEKTWSQYEVLAKRVEYAVGNRVREFLITNETGYRIQGVHLESDAKRYYPYGSLASHVLGFLNSDGQGAYGLEAIYNEELDGTAGMVVTARDARNRELLFQYDQYYDAEDGNNLVLTIDSTIQYYVERGLEDMISRFGAKNGAAGIVMDVNTGAILAIASSPSYDVNEPRSIYDTLLQAELELGDISLGDLQLRQWRNKAVNDTYEPGSTYKILTLAAALEENKVTTNTTFSCSGAVVVDGWTMRCSKKGGHGVQDLATATANSCNPAFIAMGTSIGTEVYYQYMVDFGLTTRTGVDLQGEGIGTIATAENFQNIDLAAYSFGQNFTVTPVQLLAAQAACINGGYLYTPYVVERVTDEDGNTVSQHDATPIRQVISEETSATVRTILEGVVANGTGRNGQVAGYRIGGKTGTADKANTKTEDNPQGDVVVSFLCFAPADDPQVIMLLTMDTPARDTGTYVSGGNMVAPTASAIMSDLLPYLGIAPQYTEEELSSVDATVPHLSGLTEEEAAVRIREYGFRSYRVVGDGSQVTDQTPLGGAIVPAGAELILYMGEEKSHQLCTVPDVVGKTASAANEALTEAGLLMKTSGVTSGSGIHAINQSHEPGTEVPAGTVITVQMGQQGSTAD